MLADKKPLQASDMQAAITWAGIFAQTTDPGIPGTPWNDGSYLRFSMGSSLGIGGMAIGSTFIIGSASSGSGIGSFSIGSTFVVG